MRDLAVALPMAGHVVLDLGSWLSWIIVGLIAGAVAARVVAGRGFGCIADIVVGVAGAIIGGYLLGALFNAGGALGFLGRIAGGVIGAAGALSRLELISRGCLLVFNRPGSCTFLRGL